MMTRIALPNAQAGIDAFELESVTQKMEVLENGQLPIPMHLQEWLKQNFATIAFELAAWRRAADSLNDTRTVRPRTAADNPLSARDCEADGATYFNSDTPTHGERLTVTNIGE